MPLVRKATLSPAKLAANRRNARKSRGPCTPAGKERAKYSALKHGLYLQPCTGGYREHSLRQTMAVLGEDRDEFERLHHDLVSFWQPRDAFPRMLVEQLRDLMWKQARVGRALDALMVHQVKTMESERAQRAQEIGCKTFRGSEAELTQAGLWGAQDRPSKFEEILAHLRTLTDLAKGHDFSQDQEATFNRLYGQEPTWRGGAIMRMFRHFHGNGRPVCLGGRAPGPAVAATRDEVGESRPGERALPEGSDAQLHAPLLRLLKQEAGRVAEEYELYKREHVEITAALRDTLLVPAGTQGAMMVRRFNSVARQIERTTGLLLKLETMDKRMELQAQKDVLSKAFKMKERSHDLAENKRNGKSSPAAGPHFR